MDEKEITCIVCPIGCKILVRTDGKKFKLIKGNKCKRGEEYAKSEAVNPRRILTSSILVENGEWPLVSVKTSKPIPKDKIFDVLNVIKKTKVKAPVKIGQKIVQNVADTDADIVATKTIQIV
ncbi:MAG: molybdopterin oxidoreductase [Thermoplasmata archaeon]|nr:MAG: molybdopterin oxidoreductase [Thermoplasmata archaeon]